MATGLLVFDDIPVQQVQGGEFGQAFVIVDDTRDVLLFDAEAGRSALESPSSTDFVVFDTPATVIEAVVAPADFLLVDPPREPARVVLDGPEYQDVLVITPGGPPGRQGDPGQKGDRGEKGERGDAGADGAGAYYQEFGFASPATTWTIVHNQGSLGLNVETVDTNGDSIEGYVRFVDANVLEIDWYYPMAGLARVFR